VKLKVHDSVFVPLAKLGDADGGQLPLRGRGQRAADPLGGCTATSRNRARVYEWVVDLCVLLGASRDDIGYRSRNTPRPPKSLMSHVLRSPPRSPPGRRTSSAWTVSCNRSAASMGCARTRSTASSPYVDAWLVRTGARARSPAGHGRHDRQPWSHPLPVATLPRARTAPLGEDIRLLGRVLGDTIRAFDGEGDVRPHRGDPPARRREPPPRGHRIRARASPRYLDALTPAEAVAVDPRPSATSRCSPTSPRIATTCAATERCGVPARRRSRPRWRACRPTSRRAASRARRW